MDRFLDYIAASRIALYPAQENAILELFDDRNVILNQPPHTVWISSSLGFALTSPTLK